MLVGVVVRHLRLRPALAREAVVTTVGRQVHALDQGVLVRAEIGDVSHQAVYDVLDAMTAADL